ncbi:SymE family type I addiction module toxin [Flagellimonas onchidii]|uniref:SymE family type I addiction module toxin n=1 Tax=Flagellimonas onchidii TaxID=2562684 RepID=UPI0010A5EB51|nr:SymE family type I addiction module toxin [Allomuricauda onchidii]
MKKPRKLKIHGKFRRRRWDHTTVPEIRLEGRWLEELGFEQGKTVKVIQENRVLVLILED